MVLKEKSNVATFYTLLFNQRESSIKILLGGAPWANTELLGSKDNSSKWRQVARCAAILDWLEWQKQQQKVGSE